MAKKKSDSRNKSQNIRDYLTGNPKASVKDVLTALAEKGMKVTG